MQDDFAKGSYTRIAYPKPFNHEATGAVSSTALALKAEKWGSITEKGDSGNQLSAWSLSGVNKNNSDTRTNPGSLTLWWKIADAAGTRTVSIYKDGGMATGSLVAQGSKAGDGSITLAAQNSSGITGSVTAAFKANSAVYANQLIIQPRAIKAKVTVDTQPIRYWVDNSVPTANDGLYAAAGSVIELNSADEIMNFRMIRQGGTDANVSVAYYE